MSLVIFILFIIILSLFYSGIKLKKVSINYGPDFIFSFFGLTLSISICFWFILRAAELVAFVLTNGLAAF